MDYEFMIIGRETDATAVGGRRRAGFPTCPCACAPTKTGSLKTCPTSLGTIQHAAEFVHVVQVDAFRTVLEEPVGIGDRLGAAAAEEQQSGPDETLRTRVGQNGDDRIEVAKHPLGI